MDNEKICKLSHATSRENSEKIREVGYLRAGSYGTFDNIKILTPSERKNALCLDNQKKGECVWECKAECNELFSNLKIPIEGTKTCKGYSQFLIQRNFSTEFCSHICEKNDYSISILFGGASALLCYAISNNKKTAVIGGIAGFVLERFIRGNHET